MRVSADAAETAECLLRLLAGDAAAAELLTQEVHRDVVAVPDGEMPDLPMDGFNFANMGIWVDPIGIHIVHIFNHQIRYKIAYAN